MSAELVRAILVAQVVASGMMAGLIWFVQVVHYPLFDGVGEGGFERYARRHRARTTRVVAPLMFLELVAAAALLPVLGTPVTPRLAWTGFAMVISAWGVTFFVSVPLHGRLDRAWDAGAHRRLVATNWARTALWSARFAIAIWMLVEGC